MPVKSLNFKDIGPFDEISFEFDPHINVLTGPNNSGKSVALMVMAELLTYPYSLPIKYYHHRDAEYSLEVISKNGAFDRAGKLPLLPRNKFIDDHEIFLENVGFSAFFPALRQNTDFRSEGPKHQPVKELKLHSAVGDMDSWRIVSAERHPELSKRKEILETHQYYMDDGIFVQKLVNLDYFGYRRKDPHIETLIDRIASIVSGITEGFSIRFAGIKEEKSGLYPAFETRDGVVPLNCLSQGTQSLLQWIGSLLIAYGEYYDLSEDFLRKDGILIIDEIDAHLHPSWQQRILPTLRKHFPKLQIFCSTHSPLMLAGLEAGQVHLLQRQDGGGVTVSRNEQDIVGWSADEILRGFLGVESPTDLETANAVERLKELRTKESLSDEERIELETLRHRLRDDLMGGPAEVELQRFKQFLEARMKPGSGEGDSSVQ